MVMPTWIPFWYCAGSCDLRVEPVVPVVPDALEEDGALADGPADELLLPDEEQAARVQAVAAIAPASRARER